MEKNDKVFFENLVKVAGSRLNAIKALGYRSRSACWTAVTKNNLPEHRMIAACARLGTSISAVSSK